MRTRLFLFRDEDFVSTVTVAMTLVALTTALTELDGMLYHVIIVFCALDRRCIPKPHKTAGQLQNFAKLERNLF